MKKAKNESVGMREIARKANVSIATVDRVVNGRGGVSAATHEKVNALIEALDYKPNPLASRLASRRTYRFAVLIPKVSGETDFWAVPLAGIQKAGETISAQGILIDYHLFDLNSRKSFEKQYKQILQKKPDGVLLAPSFATEATDFVRQCDEVNIPYVLIDSTLTAHQALCYVGPHLFRSGYLCAQLIQFYLHGSGTIALVNISAEPGEWSCLSQIKDGFIAYHQYHSLGNEIVQLNIPSIDSKPAQRQLDQILEQQAVKAIFVTNSRVFAVAGYLEQKGYTDVFLAGYDFLPRNIDYLKKNIIDLLLCHRPGAQGYLGLLKLYQHTVLKKAVDPILYMPIDIITRENHAFYNDHISA
ncbi:MAG: LacI family DNA-binding transcriptional regulator [Flavihumibacter sp.]